MVEPETISATASSAEETTLFIAPSLRGKNELAAP
jgi:hypothetical protein